MNGVTRLLGTNILTAISILLTTPVLVGEKYAAMRNTAIDIYLEGKSGYNAHLNVLSQPHKWWSTLKASLFGVESSIPPLMKPEGSATYSLIEKVTLLAECFYEKKDTEF